MRRYPVPLPTDLRFKSFPVLMSICPSPLKRSEAMKVFGCTLCDKKVLSRPQFLALLQMNLAGAIQAWKAAVNTPLTAEEKATKFVVPDVYGEIKEIETAEDVAAIEGQPELIHMQVLSPVSLRLFFSRRTCPIGRQQPSFGVFCVSRSLRTGTIGSLGDCASHKCHLQ